MTEENSQPEGAQQPMGETLTTTYEHLRHSEDSQELSEEARRPLPDREDGAAFSWATALLEAVAGNLNTPVEDRVFLATTMPFPNILVKLSTDPEAHVRAAVAGNHDVKDWLAGRLTKDKDAVVREAALVNFVEDADGRSGRPSDQCEDFGLSGFARQGRPGGAGPGFVGHGPAGRGGESPGQRADPQSLGRRPRP